MVRAVSVTAIIAVAGCVECPQVPGLSATECQVVSSLRLSDTLPPARGNGVADDERAALMGFEVFFDARLSKDGTVRCASCHVPEKLFADLRATSQGLVVVDRNSPSIYAAPWHRWQMWDGRADSLWSQPLLAFENEKEMDFTRLELAHRVFTSYRPRYEALFGALPPLDDLVRFPARGRPGMPAFDALPESDRKAVNLVVANVGKTVEAYERKLAFGKGRLEAFTAGDGKALSAAEREGLRVFVSRGCATCHSGGLLSDDAFHAIGWVDSPPRARREGLVTLSASAFSAAGEFFEGPKEAVPSATAEDDGAYRTPTLRNVLRTGPWGHDGRFASVADAITGHAQPGAPSLSSAEVDSLVVFFGALDAADPPLPWNGWPDR